MTLSNYIFTSESVSEGHPDKVSDRISDEIVDLFLKHDSQSRVAVETLCTTNRIVLAGEVRGPKEVTNEIIEQTARKAVKDIGYEQEGFHWENLDIECHIHSQSSDIAIGVDASGNKDEGAGDQGIMFGYAVNETPQLMPAPIVYAHKILESLAKARHSGQAPFLGPDSKSQVSLEYVDGKPKTAESVVVSTQHQDGVEQNQIREFVKTHVEKTLPSDWMCKDSNFFVNPTGRFVIGGPDGDCGLTGRKIIVDTYGGAAPHGGGAFSGKDPTKVDRSAAYAARYIAKNIVAAKIADRCLIQLSYAIGVSRPLSVYIDTYGTGEVDEDKLSKTIQELIDLSPRGIRNHLDLNRPIYSPTAAYGHFGRSAEEGFSWEKTDLVDQLLSTF
ncbi:MAG: methionine adenosyltransferase [Pseudomonadota bacterium]|nr:methionine adenosyltransferase [Pseudomonadota bacterium]